MCDETIWCNGPDDDQPVCLAEPTCDPGHEQVASQGDCLQDDAICYDVTMCGSTIWCTGGDEPECPDGFHPAEEPCALDADPAQCFTFSESLDCEADDEDDA